MYIFGTSLWSSPQGPQLRISLSLKILHNSDATRARIQSEVEDSEEKRGAFNYRDCYYKKDGDHRFSIPNDEKMN